MQGKVDVYGAVHKGIRYAFFKLLHQVGSLDTADDAAVDAVGQELQQVFQVLKLHQRGEDQFIQPLAHKLESEGARAADREHEEHSVKLQQLEALYQQLRAAPTGSDERRGLAARFYAELDVACAENLTHMRQEEARLQPRIWEAVAPPELAELTGRMRGSFAPQEMLLFLTYILPALNPDERAGLLGGMKKNAPPPFFEKVWTLAGGLLAEHQLAPLRQKLGIA